MSAPIRGTAILVWSADLQTPRRIATLFMTAQACAAMEMETELYFTADSLALLHKREQQAPVGYGLEPKMLANFVGETAACGVRLYACSQALQAHGWKTGDLVDACSGSGGVVQFAARCADPAWRTLVF